MEKPITSTEQEKKDELKSDKKEGETVVATAVQIVKKKELTVEPMELRYSSKGGLQKVNVMNNTDNRIVVKVTFNNK